MIPILMALLLYWMIVAFMAVRETRALRRRVLELEAKLEAERREVK